MKLSQTQKLMLAILIFAITGYVIYTSFFGGNNSFFASPDMVSEDATANETIQAITNLSNDVGNMSIDTQFFASPVFTSLVDFNFQKQLDQQGRMNPFADIGNDGVTAVVATSTLTKKK
jgi:hypothetical protein